MNGTQPPPLPTSPPPLPTGPSPKSGMPTWAIVLIACGAVGVVGIALIGLLAAIAIPNFVRARQTAQMNYCINNLREIDAAKQQWTLEAKKEAADSPTESDLLRYLKEGKMPACPAGGIYMINTVDKVPTCSIPGHQLPAP